MTSVVALLYNYIMAAEISSHIRQCREIGSYHRAAHVRATLYQTMEVSPKQRAALAAFLMREIAAWRLVTSALNTFSILAARF